METILIQSPWLLKLVPFTLPLFTVTHSACKFYFQFPFPSFWVSFTFVSSGLKYLEDLGRRHYLIGPHVQVVQSIGDWFPVPGQNTMGMGLCVSELLRSNLSDSKQKFKRLIETSKFPCDIPPPSLPPNTSTASQIVPTPEVQASKTETGGREDVPYWSHKKNVHCICFFLFSNNTLQSIIK